MTEYALYLESGPQHKKTMVHVLDLLGCIAQGPTTAAALAATPGAIRTYLRFLQQHGEAFDPDAAFSTTVAEHVTAGKWLANGDPDGGFGPDFGLLSAADLQRDLRRLAWIGADLGALLRTIPAAQLDTAPPGSGRPIRRIVAHISEAHGAFVRSTVGAVDGLRPALNAVSQGPTDLASSVVRVFEVAAPRLAAMTELERTQQIMHGGRTWTARRGLRVMLEHAWQHLQEIAARLPPG